MYENEDDDDKDLFAHPRAIQIVGINDDGDHKFTLNETQLRRILLDRRVVDHDAIVVSVAGAFRRGKSFMLDFMLRFLEHYQHHQSDDDACSSAWLGDLDEPLSGFHWQRGSERDTTGIYIWSKPFISTTTKHNNSNKSAAVWLMDTQGTYDQYSTVKDWSRIFAVSTMLSSVQIFNLSGNIQEDDLQHLQLFVDYGRLALLESGNEPETRQQRSSKNKPFQKLVFLVRDWMHPYEHPYGYGGGEKLLDRRLAIGPRQPFQMRQLRQHLRQCFEHIEAFLMPHPGMKVAELQFDGRLSQLDEHFKQQLMHFIPGIFSANVLVPKMVNGLPVTCRDLYEYFRAYVDAFESGRNSLPTPKSMLEATAILNNMQAYNMCLDKYTTHMDALCSPTSPYVHAAQLEREHQLAACEAAAAFDSVPKMGGEFYSRQCMQQLDEAMQSEFETYKSKNALKHHKAALTPSNAIVALLTLSSMAVPFVGPMAMSQVCIRSAFCGARLARAALIGLSVLLVGLKYKLRR